MKISERLANTLGGNIIDLMHQLKPLMLLQSAGVPSRICNKLRSMRSFCESA